MRVIFYYPAKMGGRASGSAVRHEKMLSALKARYDVEEFSGDRTARKQRIRKLKDEIKRGKRFGFLYFENLSVPLTLRLVPVGLGMSIPLPNLLNFRFLLFCRRHGVPTGYFYRDIHWPFPEAYGGPIPRWKLLLYEIFGRLDLWFLRNFVGMVFVPTEQFQAYLAQNFPVVSRPLPPGGDLRDEEVVRIPDWADSLNLLYVGICSPLYDPSGFFAGLEQAGCSVQLTYCTRKSERERFGGRCMVPRNISIVHVSGEELYKLYVHADICVQLVPPVGYGRLSFSYKVGEYLGRGKPLLVYSRTSFASLVKEFEIGWVVDYGVDSVAKRRVRLAADRDDVHRKQENVCVNRNRFSWSETVPTVRERTRMITGVAGIETCWRQLPAACFRVAIGNVAGSSC